MNGNSRPVAGVASDRGPRNENQDSYWIAPTDADPRLGMLYIVLDGVGGQQHGREAAETAGQLIANGYYQARSGGHDVVRAITIAFEQANSVIHHTGMERNARIGCTVVAVVISAGVLTVAHIGDARAYLLRDRRLLQLTEDHTWVQEQVQSGAIRPNDAAQHELRNVVTRVLGNEPTVTPAVSHPLPLLAGDRILLCSDGLYDALPPKSLAQQLAVSNPQAAANGLVSQALKRGATDNATALVMDLPGRQQAGLVALLARARPPVLIPIALIGLFILFLAVWTAGPLAGRVREDNATQAATPSATPTAEQAMADITATTPTPTLPATATMMTLASPSLCFRYRVSLVWTEEQMSDRDLCESTNYLLSNSGMNILGPDPRVVSGQGNNGCAEFMFYHVSLPDSILLDSDWDSEFDTGWVSEFSVTLPVDGVCP